MSTSPQAIFLSVVIPAYNEEARIGDTLRAVRKYLESRLKDSMSVIDGDGFMERTGQIASEIIIVDDGCRDRTCDIATDVLGGRENDRILRRAENRGKGFSVREGVLAARGRFILFTDADLSTPIEEFEKLYSLIHAGDDIVIGSRALPESDIQKRQNRFREWMGKTFNLFVRIFVLRGIRDTQCGFKLFRGEAAHDVFSRLRTCGFGFDVEALYVARRLGYKIGQVPVVWINSPQSKVRIFRSSAGMIRDLLRIKRLHRGLRNHERT